MKKSPVKYLMLVSFAALLCWGCTQQETKEEKMPITTENENAQELLLNSFKAFEESNFTKAFTLINKSVAEDSLFFMGNYSLAMNNFSDSAKFVFYAKNALSHKVELSEAEAMLKEGLISLMENKGTDITEIGQNLVEMYPTDIIVYYLLYGQQIAADDKEGQLKNLKNALEISDNPAILYNAMGYAYMGLEMPDSAKLAFDKYIGLQPDKANPYDSKGDYFMNVGEYEMAIKHYMKAFELDSTFTVSLDKANKAKAQIDTTMVEKTAEEE